MTTVETATAAVDKKILLDDEFEPVVGVVVGTRPSIVMMAPLIKALGAAGVPNFFVHSGQHYSSNMDSQLFSDLELSRPDYRLEGVAEKRTHGGQTAAMLEGIEAVLLKRRPCVLVVNGDANTSFAGALAARKLHINVAHVEAGERSYDWRMPEEHNRVMIDHIADLLFVTGARAVENLKREAVRGQIHVTGNPIVDASLKHLEIANRKSTMLRQMGLREAGYALCTMHREENVDVEANLKGALQGLHEAAQALGMPAHLMAHPRTLKRIGEFGLGAWVGGLEGLHVHESVGYLDFLNLVSNAGLVFTDSGGVQQEACIHHVPCVTLRDNTEWSETLDIGANRLASCDPGRIVASALIAVGSNRNWDVPFGGGDAAERIAAILHDVAQVYARAR